MSQQSTPSSQQPGHDELAALRRELATVHARLDRVTRRPTRRRPFARFAPLGIVALLVALMPLSLLAANPFTDLVPGSPHNGDIDLIYNAGITKGCDPPTFVNYCPEGLVTRQEMASFLARTAGLGSNKPVTNAARLAVTNPTAGTPTYAANELVRVARSAPEAVAPIINSTTFTTLASVNITAPVTGFVLVTGGATIQGTGGAQLRLRDTATGGTISPVHFVFVNNAGSIRNEAGTLTWVFPVAAGPQSYVLEALQDTGAVGAVIAGGISAQMTALFTPFGSTGAGTLDTPDPATGSPNVGPGIR